MSLSEPQAELDQKNRAFWSELCGTGLARQLGITEVTPQSLALFDQTYLGFYPYLMPYLDWDLRQKRSLEIGLGFGTLSGVLISAGADYFGLDISPPSVELVRQRVEWGGLARASERVVEGSILNPPFPEQSFDFCLSVGCLHHTGNLEEAVASCYRLLKPDGRALIMLYHRYSLRRILARLRGIPKEILGGLYDRNQSGEIAPHTDFVSRAQARRLFAAFSQVTIRSHNFDDLRLTSRLVIPRRRLLGTLDRWLGLDLYIQAVK